MSGTNPPVPPAPVIVTRATPESLQSQTFIVTVMLITLVAGTVFGVFMRASAEVVSTISSLVIGTIIGGICGFYYSSSKHQSSGDTTPTTTTVAGIPPIVTTTTGNTPP